MAELLCPVSCRTFDHMIGELGSISHILNSATLKLVIASPIFRMLVPPSRIVLTVNTFSLNIILTAGVTYDGPTDVIVWLSFSNFNTTDRKATSTSSRADHVLWHSCQHKSAPRVSVLRSMPGRAEAKVAWLQISLNNTGRVQV